MKREHKLAKEWLEKWGRYKDRSLKALDVPGSTPAFDPTNNLYIYGSEPSWKRKRIDKTDEIKYKQMKQLSSKQSIKPKIPNYMANEAMNKLDNAIESMPLIYREVAELKFIDELKDIEIAGKINRTLRTVEERTRKIYNDISLVIRTIDKFEKRNHKKTTIMTNSPLMN